MCRKAARVFAGELKHNTENQSDPNGVTAECENLKMSRDELSFQVIIFWCICQITSHIC